MNRSLSLVAFASFLAAGSSLAAASPVPFSAETITFACSAITIDGSPCTAAVPFTTLQSQGFSFTHVSGGNDFLNKSQGDPKPSISTANSGNVLEITNTSGEAFVLDSLDLAAQRTNSVTVTGFFGGSAVFTDVLSVTGSFPNACSTGFCFTTFDLPGADLVPVTALDLTFSAGNKFYLDNVSVSPAPEPDSLVLLGTGLLAASGASYRKLRRAF